MKGRSSYKNRWISGWLGRLLTGFGDLMVRETRTMAEERLLIVLLLHKTQLKKHYVVLSFLIKFIKN